jgi:hypothetical protein
VVFFRRDAAITLDPLELTLLDIHMKFTFSVPKSHVHFKHPSCSASYFERREREEFGDDHNEYINGKVAGDDEIG